MPSVVPLRLQLPAAASEPRAEHERLPQPLHLGVTSDEVFYVVGTPAAVLARLKEVAAGDPAVADRLRLLTLKTANIAPQGKASSPDGLQKDGSAGGDQAGIDGDPNTYWDKEDNKPLYRYVVTFDRPRAMEAISLVGFNHESFAPKDFDVLADGKVRSLYPRVHRCTVRRRILY
jgi:hypothetical protein